MRRDIGEQIARARLSHDLSHANLAEICTQRGYPLSGPAIWRIENGIYSPTLKTLRALAAGLDGHFIVTKNGVDFIPFGIGKGK